MEMASAIDQDNFYVNKPRDRQTIDNTGMVELSAQVNYHGTTELPGGNPLMPLPGTVDYLGMDKNQSQSISHSVQTAPNLELNYTKERYYEELSNYIKSQEEMNGYTGIDDGSVDSQPHLRNGRLETSERKNHPGHASPGNARKRSNPLYDNSGFKMCQCPQNKDQSHGSETCCCYAIQTLVFLVAIAALVLAIISIIVGKNIQMTNTKYDDLARKYQNLVENYSIMYQQVKDLTERNVSRISFPANDDNVLIDQLIKNSSQLLEIIDQLKTTVMNLEISIKLQDAVIQNMTLQISSQTNQINRLNNERANISNEVNDVQKNLTLQIQQIIPRGLANFSACSHQLKVSGTSAIAPTTRTETLNLNSSVVLSVACSTDGGTQAFLEFDISSPNTYTCVCRGQLTNTTMSRYCTIHYWTCPVIP